MADTIAEYTIEMAVCPFVSDVVSSFPTHCSVIIFFVWLKTTTIIIKTIYNIKLRKPVALNILEMFPVFLIVPSVNNPHTTGTHEKAVK